MTLRPGDLIVTGTPAGVGHAMNPPRYLKNGDIITMTTDALGAQSHRVVGG
jgi:2-keto-4-pentenoate hydratase/2-oxohepta-3-ene-1,7-dioic acid hydratase in catechol pathway